MAHRVAPLAEADLDEVWLYAAKENNTMDVATRLVDSITGRFFFLGNSPHAGRPREEFGIGMRSFPAGKYVIVYCVEGHDVAILPVVHGKRDLEALFGR